MFFLGGAPLQNVGEDLDKLQAMTSMVGIDKVGRRG